MTGKGSKEISRLLGISVKPAENHRTRLMEKLDVHGASSSSNYAARKGLLLQRDMLTFGR